MVDCGQVQATGHEGGSCSRRFTIRAEGSLFAPQGGPVCVWRAARRQRDEVGLKRCHFVSLPQPTLNLVLHYRRPWGSTRPCHVVRAAGAHRHRHAPYQRVSYARVFGAFFVIQSTAALCVVTFSVCVNGERGGRDMDREKEGKSARARERARERGLVSSTLTAACSRCFLLGLLGLLGLLRHGGSIMLRRLGCT